MPIDIDTDTSPDMRHMLDLCWRSGIPDGIPEAFMAGEAEEMAALINTDEARKLFEDLHSRERGSRRVTIYEGVFFACYRRHRQRSDNGHV